MALSNTQSQYGSLSKFFHWLIFIFVLIQIPLGYFWEDAGAYKYNAITWHKLLGLVILFIIALRLAWALINPKPDLSRLPAWERRIAYLTHGLLYLALIGMPLSGWLGSTAGGKPPVFNGFAIPMPGIHANKSLAGLSFEIHEVLAVVLLVLIGLHILAALKHHFIDKDSILIRMLPTWSHKNKRDTHPR